MTQSEIQILKTLLLQYLKNNKDKSYTYIADLVFEQNNIKVSHRTVRGYLSMLREELELDEANFDDAITSTGLPATVPPPEDIPTDIDPDESYMVDIPPSNIDVHVKPSTQEFVEFDYAGESYTFEVGLLDKVYCAYSKKGLNLSGPITQLMFKLQDKEFRSIVAKLGMNKESNPYSAHTKAKLSDSDLYEYVTSLVPAVLTTYMENDGTVTTQLHKSYKEAIIKYQNQELFLRAEFTKLKALLPKISITPRKPKRIESTEITHLVIPDMHIGLLQSNYNKEIVKEQLDEVLSLVHDAARVHVHFMGDIIQSVSGMNHKDSWKTMGPEDYGANAITNPFEILMEFLVSIPGLERVDAVGGNHGRMESDKSVENDAEGEKLIMYLLNMALPDVKVIFDANVIVDHDDPNLLLVTLHGDNPVDKEPGQKIAWEYGDKSKFVFVLTAHMHSRKQDPKDDGTTFRKTQMTSFCPIDKYGKSVAHPSLPGIKMIAATSKGLPMVVDYPLFYEND